MEQEQKQKQTIKQISCGSTYDRLPSEWQCAKYPLFVAQMQENQIFYTIPNPQVLYRCQIPELAGAEIRASFHGWVVLSKHPTWFLWNPLTSKLICLPPLIYLKHEPNQCCLSSPPDDPTSVFLLSTNGFPILTYCRLDCTKNKLKWATYSYRKELRRIIGKNGYLVHLTCCNGKVYAFNSDYSNHTVIEIDIAVEEKKVMIRLISFVEHPGCSFTRCSTTDGFLVLNRFLKGYCSELFYIDIYLEDDTRETVGDVQFYKLDMTNMIWEEMEDLKDAIIFLQVDSEYVYYSPVINTELAGYIHILGSTGKLLYSYHVKSRTISITSMSSLEPTSDMSSWGILEYRLRGDNANLKQEEDKDDGNIVVKSATISKPPVFDSKKWTRTDESYLLNLPFNILESIMEHCVCVEYMNFRATCKLCHLAAPSVQWSNKTTLKRLQSYSVASPWLMVFDKYQGIITLSDLMMGDKYFIQTPQELMGDITVHYSRYGWLLIEKDDGLPRRRMMFFNPFTSDIRELPFEDKFDWCCFSAPPTSKDCMVVGCNHQCRGSLIRIYFLGQQSLRRPNLELDVSYSYRFPTFHDKDIYALNHDGRLDVYREMDEEKYALETVVAKPPGCVGSYFLVECEQHLLLVIVGISEESVNLFKLNDFTKEWEKLDGLGKHTIYIADTCFCIEAKDTRNGE